MLPRSGLTRLNPILDFKAEPAYVLPSLEIIQEGKGDWEEIRKKLIDYARSQGSRATSENVVSAYVTPTLRNLRLILGKYSMLRLTADGVQCLDAHRKSGMPGFL